VSTQYNEENGVPRYVQIKKGPSGDVESVKENNKKQNNQDEYAKRVRWKMHNMVTPQKAKRVWCKRE